MDNYTRKYFFEEIGRILDERPIDEIRPIFLYRPANGGICILGESGNKAIGNIELIAFAEVLGCTVDEAADYLSDVIMEYREKFKE